MNSEGVYSQQNKITIHDWSVYELKLLFESIEEARRIKDSETVSRSYIMT